MSTIDSELSSDLDSDDLNISEEAKANTGPTSEDTDGDGWILLIVAELIQILELQRILYQRVLRIPHLMFLLTRLIDGFFGVS